jgi:hypothetical protein
MLLVSNFDLDKAEKIGKHFPENTTISIVNPPPLKTIKISTLSSAMADILKEAKKAVALKNG